MAGPWPFGETVTRLRREPLPGPGGKPQRDSRGQPLYGPEQAVEVKGCVVTPRQSSPPVGGAEQQARDTVIVGWTVYAPSGSDFRTTDRVRIRGEVCDITGEPGDWGRSPFTGACGPVQFAADRVTG